MRKGLAIIILLLAFTGLVVGQETYEFETCDQTGRTGPSQADCDSEYDSDFADEVDVVEDGKQVWEVPSTGEYEIMAEGASGRSSGGDGAEISGEFELEEGDEIQIIVGQTGGSSGGGGGSFVVLNGEPILVAGGGGGGGSNSGGEDANTGTAGTGDGSGNVQGGTGGSGGDVQAGSGYAGTPYSGAGFSGDGDTLDGSYYSHSSRRWSLGGTGSDGGRQEGAGGFGGGGGGFGGGWGTGGGGGGGYSGGAAGYRASSSQHGGGGGGSLNEGNNQNNIGGANSEEGSVEITLLETEPEDPSNPEPSEETDTSPVYDDDPELSVDVDHPADENLDVTFYHQDGGNTEIGTDSVNSGDTATTVWDDRERGEQYDWFVEVCDEDNDCITSSTWTFEVSGGPEEPQNPNPADEEVVREPEGTLEMSAQYIHEDGVDGSMDIHYMREDDTDFETESCDDLQDEETCEINVDVDSGYDYNWYAVSHSEGQSEEGSEWMFSVNTPPEPPELISPDDDSESQDPDNIEFEAYVEDEDGDDLDVTFFVESENENHDFSVDDVEEDNVVGIEEDGFETSKEYDWYVEACDDHECTISEDTYTFTTLFDPDFASESPSDGGFIIDDQTLVSVNVESLDEEEVTASLYRVDEDGDRTDNLGESNFETEETIEEDYGGVEFDETYYWEVEAYLTNYDHVINSEVYSFDVLAGGSFRINTDFDYDYSSVIKSEEETEFVVFELTNDASDTKNLELELEGLDAEFEDTESSEITINDLGPGETETRSIEISEEEQGYHELTVETNDTDLGSTNVDTLPVHVRETQDVTVNRVPGINLIQIITTVALVLFVLIRKV